MLSLNKKWNEENVSLKDSWVKPAGAPGDGVCMPY